MAIGPDASRDKNFIPTLMGVSSIDLTTPVTLIADPISHRLLVDLGGGGSGSVTNFSFTNANGISGVVTNPTTTPNLTLTLGAITPTSVNGNTITTGTGTLTLNTFTLTVAGTSSITGTNTGDQTTISGNAGSATTVGITDDNATNATMFPTWVTANTGNLPEKVSSTKLSWNPSTGAFTGPIVTASAEMDTLDNVTPTAVGGRMKIYSKAQNGASRPALVQNLGATEFILGRDNCVIGRNSTGSTITKGMAVYTNSFFFVVPQIIPAQANSLSTLVAIGIAVDDIAPNNFGFVMKLGILSGLNTSGFSAGDALYVSPTVAGGLTNVRPSGTTNFVDVVAEVFQSDATNGQILVRAVGGLLNAETGTNAATWTGSAIVGTTVNATTGFQVAGAATSGNVLTGNGTNFVSTAPVVTLTNTATLTNKRITERVLALSANSATPAINTDNFDVVHITAQTAAITSFTTNLTGTPVDGDTLRISVTGTGAVALTFGTSFEASTVALPTTTVTTARLDMGFFWNTETSKWRIVATA